MGELMSFNMILASCTVLLSLLLMSQTVDGHGLMTEPASRQHAWRIPEFKEKGAEIEYTDNELNCGGLSVQWNQHKGKCGVCGDEYGKSPQFAYPGKFAKDIIVRTYTQGQIITVTAKITANHKGYFRWAIGELKTKPITEAQLIHKLPLANGRGYQWKLPAGNGQHTTTLKLPADLTCNHCVLQWWWTAGNNWGKEQETFVNCADVAITPDGKPETVKPVPAVTVAPAVKENKYKPESKSKEGCPKCEKCEIRPHPSEIKIKKVCLAINEYKDNIQYDKYCEEMCNTSPHYCWENMCKCKEPKPPKPETLPCEPVGAYKGNAAYKSWCIDNCKLNWCIKSFCSRGCAQHCVNGQDGKAHNWC